jgi:hypothetical protein
VRVGDIWIDRNLRDTPFFHQALDPSRDTSYPIDLFVGRADEANEILADVLGTSSSRSAVQGSPGVGKTSLASFIKERAGREGIGSRARFVSLGHQARSEDVLLDILGYVYQVVLANGDISTEALNAVRTARQILEVQENRNLSASVGIPTMGSVGGGTSVSYSTPPSAIRFQAPLLVEQLLRLAKEHCGLSGILLHLNNLDNLAAQDIERAGLVLRDLRDWCLMLPDLHVLVVGTDYAVQNVIGAHPQLRTVFTSIARIQPLALAEVESLLEKRYAFLRISPEEPVPLLVTSEALGEIYRLFRGDLRGVFQALHRGILRLTLRKGLSPRAPAELGPLIEVLADLYRGEVTREMGTSGMESLKRLAAAVGKETFTQAEVRKRLKMNANSASEFVRTLLKFEFAVLGERVPEGPGRPRERYLLSGAARLAALD